MTFMLMLQPCILMFIAFAKCAKFCLLDFVYVQMVKIRSDVLGTLRRKELKKKKKKPNKSFKVTMEIFLLEKLSESL